MKKLSKSEENEPIFEFLNAFILKFNEKLINRQIGKRKVLQTREKIRKIY